MSNFAQFGGVAKKTSYISRGANCIYRTSFKMLGYSLEHPAKWTLYCALALLLFVAVAALVRPPQAEAIAPIVAGALGALGVGALAWGFNEWDPVTGIITGLQNFCNVWFDASRYVIYAVADASMLDDTFSALFAGTGLYELFYAVHSTAVIPIANVVVVIFLVWGLWKPIAKANETKADVDVVGMLFTFVWCGFALVVVNASWEIMVALYSLSRMLIQNIIATPTTALSSATLLTDAIVGDEVTDFGALLALALISFIFFLITAIVCLVSQAVIVVRAIQIYIYTAISAVPAAFIVSDGGREMTKAFLKRYVALLLSGAILVLLYIAYAAVVGHGVWSFVEVKDPSSVVVFIIQCLTPIGIQIAFLWSFFKSGSWARDLVGA